VRHGILVSLLTTNLRPLWRGIDRESKIEQIAALPLGSRIKLDVWTDQISLIKTGPIQFLSGREKMPFEVTPVSAHLTRVGARKEGNGNREQAIISIA
jgi:hypothetical protein